jgi:hypothetical protein
VIGLRCILSYSAYMYCVSCVGPYHISKKDLIHILKLIGENFAVLVEWYHVFFCYCTDTKFLNGFSRSLSLYLVVFISYSACRLLQSMDHRISTHRNQHNCQRFMKMKSTDSIVNSKLFFLLISVTVSQLIKHSLPVVLFLWFCFYDNF